MRGGEHNRGARGTDRPRRPPAPWSCPGCPAHGKPLDHASASASTVTAFGFGAPNDARAAVRMPPRWQPTGQCCRVSRTGPTHGARIATRGAGTAPDTVCTPRFVPNRLRAGGPSTTTSRSDDNALTASGSDNASRGALWHRDQRGWKPHALPRFRRRGCVARPPFNGPAGRQAVQRVAHGRSACRATSARSSMIRPDLRALGRERRLMRFTGPRATPPMSCPFPSRRVPGPLSPSRYAPPRFPLETKRLPAPGPRSPRVHPDRVLRFAHRPWEGPVIGPGAYGSCHSRRRSVPVQVPSVSASFWERFRCASGECAEPHRGVPTVPRGPLNALDPASNACSALTIRTGPNRSTVLRRDPCGRAIPQLRIRGPRVRLGKRDQDASPSHTASM